MRVPDARAGEAVDDGREARLLRRRVDEFSTGLAGVDAGHVRRAGPVALLPQTQDELRLKMSVLDVFRSRVPVYIDEAEALLRAYLSATTSSASRWPRCPLASCAACCSPRSSTGRPT